MVSNRGPCAYQPNALPLGQTGSHWLDWLVAQINTSEREMESGDRQGWVEEKMV